MKKIVVLTVMLFILLNVATVNALSQIRVLIDGNEVIFTDAAPFADENSRTLVPLRAVGEAMGLTVNWDNEQQQAIFTKEYTWENSPLYKDCDDDGENDAYLGLERVIFKIGDNKSLYEESWYDKGTAPNENSPTMGGIGEISMDTAAIIKDSRTYAPIRYLAEAFRYNVGWDNKTKTVMLNYMYSVDRLGMQVELVACWEDIQGWMFIVGEESDIQSIDILSVAIDGKNSEYSILTEEEQSEIYENGEELGKYLNGFTVKNQLEVNTYYNYKVKFVVTMKYGAQKFGFADIGLYFDGGQGGYI